MLEIIIYGKVKVTKADACFKGNYTVSQKPVEISKFRVDKHEFTYEDTGSFIVIKVKKKTFMINKTEVFSISISEVES